MIARLLSAVLKRSLKPFVFTSGPPRAAADDGHKLGLYVHIPFCTTLCAFCPYFKVPYDRALVPHFVGALTQEIRSAAATDSGRRSVSSVYFGGGTPALLTDHLPAIRTVIDESFGVDGPCGIELHPDDIGAGTATELRAAGFDMVSIGIQSFQGHCLRSLGREPADLSHRIAMMRDGGFAVVDVDLIFGMPDQRVRDIQEDFRIAASHGATQISTYPFIDFTYAGNKRKPVGRRQKRKLLNAVLEVSDEVGFERTSVWTFARKGTGRYSSVTRDGYLGFGPSAASLLRSSFSVNVFSVPEYVRALQGGRSPTALSVDLTKRERALFWFFWNAYNLKIERGVFTELFGGSIEDAFGLELKVARRLGILERRNNAYAVTAKGSYLFHLIEQQYTNQYIDKVWRLSTETPWPERLVLR